MELMQIFQNHCERLCRNEFPTDSIFDSDALQSCLETCLPSAAANYLARPRFDLLNCMDCPERKELSAKLLTGEGFITTNCSTVNKLWFDFMQLVEKHKNHTEIYKNSEEFGFNKVMTDRAVNNLNHAREALGCDDTKNKAEL